VAAGIDAVQAASTLPHMDVSAKVVALGTVEIDGFRTFRQIPVSVDVIASDTPGILVYDRNIQFKEQMLEFIIAHVIPFSCNL